MKTRTMNFPTVSLLLLLGAGLCHSQVITPAGVTATSSLDANRNIGHTISGAGLSGGSAPILEQTHNNNVNGTYWLGAISAGQVLTFDLGGANDVQFIHIWQYWRDNIWANRAIQSFDIAYSTDGGSNYTTPVAGPSGLTLGAAASPAQTLDLGSVQSGVTHVRFTNIQSFGASDFLGLAEIRFGGPGSGPAMALGDPEVAVLDYDQAEATSFLSGEDASSVTLYWGTVDQGESQTGWDGSASLGAQTAGAAIPVPAALMASLTQGTTYHCRFYAQSATSAATAWSNAPSFSTPNALLLTNPQTTYPAYDEADVTVTSNRDTDTTRLYWGTTDPGATAAGWDHGPVNLGARFAGTFPVETLSGLTENTTYHFRYYCESSSPVASTAWSDAGSFTTPNALELIFPEATAVAFNQADVAVTTNFDTTSMDLYWGTSDPGATTTGWDHGPVNLGAQSAGTIPAQTLSGLTELTQYFFRFVATSSSPVASTAWSAAGTFSTPFENAPVVITPSAVTATNSLAAYPIANTINSSGLNSSAPSVLDWTHVATPANSNNFSWLGTKAGTEIIYELPGTNTLNYLFFWSYWGGAASRSLTAFDISFSSDGVTYSTPSTITLGTPGSAVEMFNLGTQANVTHVKFANLQNGGDSLAGIGEVRFGGETGLITSFQGAGATGVIDQQAKTVALEVPFGTDLATLAPTFTLSSGTADQTSGEPPTPTFAAQNPVTYTVTDTSTEPPTVNAYQVTVTVAPPPAALATLVIDLGDSPGGTTIVSGTFIGTGPTNLPIPALPPGSILRSIEVDAVLEASDVPGSNYASDLTVLFDPTPGDPGNDFSLALKGGTAVINFGAANLLSWPASADTVAVSPLVDTKTDADWTALVGDIDLATTGLFLGNTFGTAPEGGTWSGTITLTYDMVGTGSEYDTWSGGEPFAGDKNGDGISNGLAFLLGAADPDENPLRLLPAVSETAGGLVMSFSMLDAASRGTATLSVEHSRDLGIGDPWTTVAVPDTSEGPTSGVTFVVSGSGTLDVEATIGSAEAAAGKLFGRLKATE